MSNTEFYEWTSRIEFLVEKAYVKWLKPYLLLIPQSVATIMEEMLAENNRQRAAVGSLQSMPSFVPIINNQYITTRGKFAYAVLPDEWIDTPVLKCFRSRPNQINPEPPEEAEFRTANFTYFLAFETVLVFANWKTNMVTIADLNDCGHLALARSQRFIDRWDAEDAAEAQKEKE